MRQPVAIAAEPRCGLHSVYRHINSGIRSDSYSFLIGFWIFFCNFLCVGFAADDRTGDQEEDKNFFQFNFDLNVHFCFA